MICGEISKEDRKRLREAIRDISHKPLKEREEVAFLLKDGKLGKQYTSLGHVPKGESAAWIPKELAPDLKPTYKDAIRMMTFNRPVLCKGTRVGLNYDVTCYTTAGIFEVLKHDLQGIKKSLAGFKALGIGETELEGKNYAVELRRRARTFAWHVNNLLDDTLDTCILSLGES